MIAADTSVIIDYLQGSQDGHAQRFIHNLALGNIVFPPVVITELFSDPKERARIEDLMADADPLALHPGYWERAGKSRSLLKAKGLKAKTADALIAQSCIDHEVPLLTRDADFQHYAAHCGLKLAE